MGVPVPLSKAPIPWPNIKYQMGYFTSQLFLSIKNKVLLFWIPLQIYQVSLIYGMFSGSFLDNLEWLFFLLFMVAEINNFSSKVQYNFAKSKMISKCKNDRPWKN